MVTWGSQETDQIMCGKNEIFKMLNMIFHRFISANKALAFATTSRLEMYRT